MNAISPLAVLARGYSLTTDGRGKLVLDAGSLIPGDKISTRLAKGVVHSTVDQTNPEPQ